MTRLTSKDKEILYNLTENLLQHLKSNGAVRITDKYIIIYKSVEDKNPQNIFIALLKEYGVRRCYYGHLHGNFIRHAVQGSVDGITYRLISADGLNFCPLKIEKPMEITKSL